MSDSSWAPFGPGGDDDPPPEREPEPEPVAPPTPPVEEPPPVEPPPPVEFAPPVVPERQMSDLEWLDAQPAAPTPAPPPPPVSTWPGPPPTPYGVTKRTSGNATAALTLGVFGIVMCPLIASVPAIVLGQRAKREIRENPNELGGGGVASWGVALGWVGVAWGVFVLLVVLAGASVNP